jgi:hypothetical protein
VRLHIAEWRRNRAGPMLAIYALGAAPSAARSATLSPADKCRRWRGRDKIRKRDFGLGAQLARMLESV